MRIILDMIDAWSIVTENRTLWGIDSMLSQLPRPGIAVLFAPSPGSAPLLACIVLQSLVILVLLSLSHLRRVDEAVWKPHAARKRSIGPGIFTSF